MDSHRLQMLNYSNAAGIRYAGLTDGSVWELYEIFKQGTLEERRLLDVVIVSEPAYQAALKFLLLWRPNLASGMPVEASEPILGAVLPDGTEVEPPDNGQRPKPLPPSGEGWMRLSDLTSISKGMAPLAIWFPTGEERPCTYWWHVLSEVAEWLVRTGKLTADKCPVKVAGVGGKRHIVHIGPQTLMGKHSGIHTSCRTLFTWMLKPGMNAGKRTKTLLQHCDGGCLVQSGLNLTDSNLPTSTITA